MRSILFIVAAVIAGVNLFGLAWPQQKGTVISRSRKFTLNGISYSLGGSFGETSVTRKELLKRGVDLGRISQDTAEPVDRIVDTLEEIRPDRRSRPIPVPSCFLIDQDMRLEAEEAFVDIGRGRILAGGRPARERLEAAGWKVVEAENAGGTICLATKTEGRERSVGILEESEGRCLFIRRSEK